MMEASSIIFFVFDNQFKYIFNIVLTYYFALFSIPFRQQRKANTAAVTIIPT